MVRVRMSPAPTGMAHIGTAYMSLFNLAFARKYGGKFILRLEDTDRERHVPEAEKVLYRALSWLGLEPDESPVKGGEFGPYRQSQRLLVYQETAKKLVAAGKAKEKKGAIWIEPRDEVYSWDDAVRGRIEFRKENLKEWVILRANGWPTYNFAAVVDDLAMEITHVIRGEEHISNTPLQLMVYRALEKQHPVFAHMPVLRGCDHKKLSKRRDPVSIDWYREQGYLPEAILNFLALQGWSHPLEKDIFSLEEFIKEMTLERVKTSAPVFDFKKLDWINGQYIQKMKDVDLVDLLSSSSRVSKILIIKTVPLVKERMKKLAEFPDLVSYFVEAPPVDKNLVLKQTNRQESDVKSVFEQIIYSCENVSNWNVQNLEKVGHELLKDTGWSPKELFMTIRVALSGRTATPPLFETMEVLGKEEVLERLKGIDSRLKFLR